MNAFAQSSRLVRTPSFCIPGAMLFPTLPAVTPRPAVRRIRLGEHGNVSVGHGPGTPRNEGTAQDRSTPAKDSNLTEIDATQEPAAKGQKSSDQISEKASKQNAKGGASQGR